jgi:hypothetical protein
MYLDKLNEIKNFVISDIKSPDSKWSGEDEFFQSDDISLRKDDGKWQVRLKKSEKGNYHDITDIKISKWYLLFLIYFYIIPQINKTKKTLKSLTIIEDWNSIGNKTEENIIKKSKRKWSRRK